MAEHIQQFAGLSLVAIASKVLRDAGVKFQNVKALGALRLVGTRGDLLVYDTTRFAARFVGLKLTKGRGGQYSCYNSLSAEQCANVLATAPLAVEMWAILNDDVLQPPLVQAGGMRILL